MNEGLNLLPSVAKFQAAKIKLKKRINLAMSVFLGFWVLSAVIIFGMLWFNNYSLKKAESQNEVALNKYKSLVTSVVLSKKNKYQAKLVGQILNERFEYGSLIQKINSLFSENISIEDFNIKEKKSFVLKGDINNGANISEVEKKIKDINLGYYTDFKSAKLNSIEISGNVWTFELEVELT